ncbi:MAG TPA: hypothetical protein VM030_08160 [Acidimicrobiales bacterium]|nr:hypothetical protein [Acidimicrobiales bacterium]
MEPADRAPDGRFGRLSRRFRRVVTGLSLVVAVVTLGLSPAPGRAAPSGAFSAMTHVANIRYPLGKVGDKGTDLELTTIAGRDYAFAGTYGGGLHVIDVTDPRHPDEVAFYSCSASQGDVQVFRRAGRSFITYTADNGFTRSASGQCYTDAKVPAGERYGTFIIDVTVPARPRAVGWVAVPAGSHNQSVHPSGRWMYNSNSDLENPVGVIEVIDLAELREPEVVSELPLQTGLSSHDITFSDDGTRAYVAAVTHTLVLDTTDPGRPVVIGRIIDPAVNIHHQADPITLQEKGLGIRRMLVVTDELAGAEGNAFCPGGGLHVYDITGGLERAPVKVGFFAIPEVRRTDGPLDRCTAHVLRMYPQQRLMTIAWYAAGVRVIDLSGLVGVSVGGPKAGPVAQGMREVGYFRFPDSEVWAAKTNRIAADGSFYLYANDLRRGFDVFRYLPGRSLPGATASGGGTWLTADETAQAARARGVGSTAVGDRTPVCLLPPAAA